MTSMDDKGVPFALVHEAITLTNILIMLHVERQCARE